MENKLTRTFSRSSTLLTFFSDDILQRARKEEWQKRKKRKEVKGRSGTNFEPLRDGQGNED